MKPRSIAGAFLCARFAIAVIKLRRIGLEARWRVLSLAGI